MNFLEKAFETYCLDVDDALRCVRRRSLKQCELFLFEMISKSTNLHLIDLKPNENDLNNEHNSNDNSKNALIHAYNAFIS